MKKKYAIVHLETNTIIFKDSSDEAVEQCNEMNSKLDHKEYEVEYFEVIINDD